VGEPCTRCNVFRLCGGRCFYANVTKRWGSEAYGQVCKTVKNLIEAISNQMPRIRKLVCQGKVLLKDFEYVKYNGCEIIP
jgi:uncharacterized protein